MHVPLQSYRKKKTKVNQNPEDPSVSQGINGNDHQPLIEMQDIRKIYKTHAGEFPALKGVSAQFYPGQFVSIIGKSGSGKSTLLNMITGIDRPTSGKILIDGTYLQDLSESQFSEWRGRNLGIVFQFFQLLPMLTLLENTILPMDFCQMYSLEEREERAQSLLKMVGLEDFIDQLPSSVSSGQEQCAAIARALANDPPIIVADEPTGNLDSKTAELVLQLIDRLVAQGKTVLVVTHDEAVARRASRTLVICDGELVDEEISTLLPSISHRSMLNIANQSVEVHKQPGEGLFSRSEALPGILVVLEGELEIRNTAGKKLAHGNIGPVITAGNIRRHREAGHILSAGSTSPARLKLVSEDDFQKILATSRSLQRFVDLLENRSPQAEKGSASK